MTLPVFVGNSETKAEGVATAELTSPVTSLWTSSLFASSRFLPAIVSKVHDQLIRGQCPGHVTSIDQLGASI